MIATARDESQTAAVGRPFGRIAFAAREKHAMALRRSVNRHNPKATVFREYYAVTLRRDNRVVAIG
jgi:hypothetical protein